MNYFDSLETLKYDVLNIASEITDLRYRLAKLEKMLEYPKDKECSETDCEKCEVHYDEYYS